MNNIYVSINQEIIMLDLLKNYSLASQTLSNMPDPEDPKTDDDDDSTTLE